MFNQYLSASKHQLVVLLPSHSKGLQPRVPPCLLWLNLYPLYTDVYGVCVSVHTSKSTSLTTLKCSQASFWLSRVVSNDRWFGSHVFQRSAFDLGRRKGDGRELLMQGNHPEIQSRRFVKRFIDHTKQTSSMHSIDQKVAVAVWMNCAISRQDAKAMKVSLDIGTPQWKCSNWKIHETLCVCYENRHGT